MTYTHSDWMGFHRLDFEFEAHPAILVLPQRAVPGNKWLMKTEYFGAFPNFELEMLQKGYFLTHVESFTRWHDEKDDALKDRFCSFLQEEFGLCEKYLPMDMSCGGMQAVYFASAYPQRVAGLYLDAPVMNLLSCPVGVGTATDGLYPDFVAKTKKTKEDLINFRNHPVDRIPRLLEHRIPPCLCRKDIRI